MEELVISLVPKNIQQRLFDGGSGLNLFIYGVFKRFYPFFKVFVNIH